MLGAELNIIMSTGKTNDKIGQIGKGGGLVESRRWYFE